MSRNIAQWLGGAALVLFVVLTLNVGMYMAHRGVIPLPLGELLLSGAIVLGGAYWNYRIAKTMRRSKKEQIAIIKVAVGELVRVEIDAAIGRILRLSDLGGVMPDATPPPAARPKPYSIVRAREGD